METKYTKLNPDLEIVTHSVRSDLTPALGAYNHRLVMVSVLTPRQVA